MVTIYRLVITQGYFLTPVRHQLAASRHARCVVRINVTIAIIIMESAVIHVMAISIILMLHNKQHKVYAHFVRMLH
jgi:signal transduction histidine kinase